MLGNPHPIRSALAVATACGLALAASACGDDGDEDAGTPSGEETSPESTEATGPFFGGHQSEVYGDDASWLCKPGVADNVCERNLDTTVVHADGTTEVQPHEPAENPPVDCFYVYPTVNIGGPANADLVPDEGAEIWTTFSQAARLTSACRVFAPMYRQFVIAGEPAEDGVDAWEVAYQDVLDAFKHYIDNESEGRDFVLLGHSQGSRHLMKLMAEEIDNEPALLDRMVAAFPVGWAINVPPDEPVGGAFQNIPVCESPDQTQCVVGYSSYRAPENPGDPPGHGPSDLPPAYGSPREATADGAVEGTPAGEDMTVICANPASLGGGAASLTPTFGLEPPPTAVIGDPAVQPFADPGRTSEITTPFVTYPDMLEGECVYDGEYSYLSVAVNSNPADVRTHDIYIDQNLELMGGDWGLHVIDMNVAQDDIISLIEQQAAG